MCLKQHKQPFALELQLSINHAGVLPLSVLVLINRLEFKSFKTLSECPHSACLGMWEMLRAQVTVHLPLILNKQLPPPSPPGSEVIAMDSTFGNKCDRHDKINTFI